WKRFAASEERLHQYRIAPESCHPQPKEALLDLTAGTASEMRRSPWNRYIICHLASNASLIFQRNPTYYAKVGEDIDWVGLFEERMYQHLFALQEARDGRLEEAYESKKKTSLLRKMRVNKMNRRLKICRTMTEHGGQGVAANTFWHDMLDAINYLDVAGMSDEEETLDEAGNKVLMVRSPNWRNPKFKRLLDEVDRIPSSETTLFPPLGRPRTTRIRSLETVQRKPPRGLSASFFRDGFNI
ncbi:hypothetical protein F5878DRAFT_548571, partial [Lentinula raphanica]